MPFDPSLPGNWDGVGPMPPVVMVHPRQQLVRYTHTDQFNWFKEWLDFSWNNNVNARFDEEDPTGTTIRWYWAYRLPLGGFLYQGRTVYTEEQALFYLAPTTEWPDDITQLFGAVSDEAGPLDEEPS